MYFVELVSVFLFFLLVGAIFTPFLGGCFILFLVLLILGAVVVFFSLNFVWFILAGVLFYLAGFVIKLYKWYQLPDYNAYATKHPGCKKDDVICCYSCGSDKTIHKGLLNHKSKLRYYACSLCGAILFRFKVL